MAVVWQDKLSVGNDEIDNDHKYLISLINTIEAAINCKVSQQVLKGFVGQLMAYTKKHFHREEKLQVEIQFPSRDAHKQEHEKLIERLDSINKEFGSYLGFDSLIADQTDAQRIIELTEALRDWLMEHILIEDLEMKSYFVQE